MTPPETEPECTVPSPHGTVILRASDAGGAFLVIPDYHVAGIVEAMVVTGGTDLNLATLTLDSGTDIVSIRYDHGNTPVRHIAAWTVIDEILACLNGPATAVFRLDLLRWTMQGLEEHLAWLEGQAGHARGVADTRAELAVARRALAAHTETRIDVREVAVALCAGSPDLVAEMTPAELIATAEMLTR